MRPFEMSETHSVTNQPPPLADYDLFSTDSALTTAVAAEGGDWAAEGLTAFGRLLGTAENFALGDLANRNSPVLHVFDRYGYRIDEVEFHPAWHRLM